MKKKYPLWVFGPAALATAIGVLVPPGVSQALWDIGEWDTCATAASGRNAAGKTTTAQFLEELRFCCDRSGGEWDTSERKCEAPPATAQTAPQSPGEVVQAPTAGTADPGQNPERTGDGTYEVVPIGPGGPVLFNP
ncbi:hypothetical protein H7J88_23190 [Mycolicibacterium flavescens]|uniref:Uncharacterized protein n=1 Tax=Mycolicibacterium flavescens TaxID=1776 RepID=A0A1E3RJX7_MYCFV|nr:hypothetical protein [Mycolicibacterium flavescens]MCV7282544.1 hypothetical protein [Mycolicibacterium flavescens]ODQ90171.1 hypothetical protein BHQ18_12105 [Mycolicibacterium flavescens]